MRPINSVSSSSSSSDSSFSGIKIWKSPIPYLFGGLAIMLAIISVALVILVCSYRKHDSESSSAEEDAAEEMKQQAMAKNIETDSEPEVLVIMAGDHNPTYLAKPIITSSIYCTCGAAQSQPQPQPTEPTTTE